MKSIVCYNEYCIDCVLYHIHHFNKKSNYYKEILFLRHKRQTYTFSINSIINFTCKVNGSVTNVSEGGYKSSNTPN